MVIPIDRTITRLLFTSPIHLTPYPRTPSHPLSRRDLSHGKRPSKSCRQGSPVRSHFNITSHKSLVPCGDIDHSELLSFFFNHSSSWCTANLPSLKAPFSGRVYDTGRLCIRPRVPFDQVLAETTLKAFSVRSRFYPRALLWSSVLDTRDPRDHPALSDYYSLSAQFCP